MAQDVPRAPAAAPSGLPSLLRHAVDASGEVVFVTDTSGIILYVNHQFTATYGYTEAEVVGLVTPRILKSERQSAEFYRTFWNSIVRGESVRSTHVNRTKSGRLVTVESTTSAVVEHGITVGYLALQRDVTAQREADRAAELAHVAIEHAPDAVCWFDPAGRIRYVNRMTTSLSGYSRDELREQCIFDLLSDGSPEWFDSCWQDIVRVGALSLKTGLLRSDGRTLPVEMRVTRVLYGQETYGCALLRDVSERELLEAELLQAQKMEAIGRLAGGLAHDFNNLLTAISGYADLALAQISDRAVAADVREIRGAAERASSLTGQLLTFSRRQPSHPELVDLNEAMARTLRMLGRLVGEDVAVVFGPVDELWPVRIDPGQLDQVLINLAVNARDAMPKGGTLTFDVRNVNFPGDEPGAAGTHSRTGAYVAIGVKDTGSGIPVELQSRILEPFFTTKPAGKGTGLGLSTVYGIVGQAGGFLTVDSEVGRGTTVTVHLPQASEDSTDGVRHLVASSERPVNGATVLLVEDDVNVRTVAARFLAQRGFRVIVAQDVDDALRIGRGHGHHIDLLLTDIVMPVLNGPDLAQRIVEWRPAMRVLYVSGYTEALGFGSEQTRIKVVRKPFTADALATAVRHALSTN